MTLNFTEMQDSLYNTPPCWSIYVCGLVFKHLLAAGGIDAVEANNAAKVQAAHAPAPPPVLLRQHGWAHAVCDTTVCMLRQACRPWRDARVSWLQSPGNASAFLLK